MPNIRASDKWQRLITRDEFFYVVEDNYDESIELAIPLYREMHDEIVRVACGIAKERIRILDLGSGTGKTSYCLLRNCPGSTVRAVDLFPEMHRHAKRRLRRFGNRIEYVTGDFMAIELGDSFDLCVSSLAIHHQTSRGKRVLFSRIHRALNPDGVLMMIDWTRFADAVVQDRASQVAEYHARNSVVDPRVAQEWCEHWRNKNRPETTEDLCRWLKDCGFAHADCIFRYYGIALLCALKGATLARQETD